MYKQISDTIILRVVDQAYIPVDPQNADYQQHLKWVAEGGVVEPVPPPPQPAPQSIDRRQFYTGLARLGLISEDEAFAAVGDGAKIPARLLGFLDDITDPDALFDANMLLAGANVNRDHPMTGWVAGKIGWDAADIDGFFRFAAAL